MRYQTVFALVLGVLGLHSGHAQPHYPKNFAGSTYNATNHLAERHKAVNADKASEVIEEMAEQEEALPKKEVVSTVPTGAEEIPIKEDGVEVLSIGGYIDARDAKHFEDSISDLRVTAMKYDLGIGEVYGIGNYGWLFNRPEISFTIIARGGKPRVRHSIPKELPINLSPAWLVTTKLGTIILEGVGPLENFFNAEGKLVVSKLVRAEPSKAEGSRSEAAITKDQKS